MAYVYRPQLSGISNLFQMPTIPASMLPLIVGRTEEALLPGMVMELRPTVRPDVMPAIQPTIRPAVMPAFQPTFGKEAAIARVRIEPPITQKEAAIARVRIEPPVTKKEADIARARIEAILQRVPSIALARIDPSAKAPSGATYESTTVTVVPGTYPFASRFTGAVAPLVGGRGMSLKESEPIVTVAPSAQGITLVDVPAPEVLPTFVEAAAVEPSPFLKYGLLAIGAYIMYDSFVKSKPKKRRRRR